MKYIDRDKEEQAATVIGLLCIFGAIVAFIISYGINSPGASAFAFIVGVSLLLVAWGAAWEVAGMDEEDYDG